MPLLRNNEKFEIPSKMKAQIEKEFNSRPNWNIVFPPERIKKNKDNTRSDRPKLIVIPLSCTIVGSDNMSETYRYFETFRENDKNIKVFTPDSLELNSKLRIHSLDLFYYLKYICPYGKNSETTSQSHVNLYEIDMPNIRAKTKVEEERESIKIRNVIYNEATDEKIIEIAYAFNINNASDYSVDELRLMLWNAVSSGSNGIEKWNKIVDSDKLIKIRSIARKAIDKNLVKIVEAKGGKPRRWVYVAQNSRGQYTEACDISPLQDDFDTLCNHLEKDSAGRLSLEKLVAPYSQK